MINYDDVYANFNISERMLLDIKQNYPHLRDENGRIIKEKVRMSISRFIDGDKYPFQGHLDYWDLGVEEGTGTYAVRGIFKNPDGELIPGLQVKIRVIPKDGIDALLVPDIAIGTDQTGRYVLVLNEKDEVKRRAVTPGARYGEMQVVLDGLAENDRVIVEGMQRARLDAVVTPTVATLKPVKMDVVEKLSSETADGGPLPPPQPAPLDDSTKALFPEGDTDAASDGAND